MISSTVVNDCLPFFNLLLTLSTEEKQTFV